MDGEDMLCLCRLDSSRSLVSSLEDESSSLDDSSKGGTGESVLPGCIVFAASTPKRTASARKGRKEGDTCGDQLSDPLPLAALDCSRRSDDDTLRGVKLATSLSLSDWPATGMTTRRGP